MSPHILATVLATFILTSANATAHEFWIEPEQFQVQSGAPITASLRNGEEFKGSQLAFFEKRSTRHDVISLGKTRPIEGRMGDIPAITVDTVSDGLVILVHQTTPSTLTYKSWEKFQKFADHKDFADIRTRHSDRDLPEKGFDESYTRYVKALVAAGDGTGADVQAGMETEFVALTNPYTDDLTGGMLVQLFYQSAPRANAQVEVFERGETGEVSVSLLRTDERGQVVVPVRSGHTYLLDAVALRPASPGVPAVWETLWAGLTFAVP